MTMPAVTRQIFASFRSLVLGVRDLRGFSRCSRSDVVVVWSSHDLATHAERWYYRSRGQQQTSPDLTCFPLLANLIKHSIVRAAWRRERHLLKPSSHACRVVRKAYHQGLLGGLGTSLAHRDETPLRFLEKGASAARSSAHTRDSSMRQRVPDDRDHPKSGQFAWLCNGIATNRYSKVVAERRPCAITSEAAR